MTPNAIKKSIKKFKEAANGFLYLDNRSLAELPYEILKHKHEIKNLNLAHNLFRSLPDWIIELENLENLNISNNELESLPEGIGKLKKLSWLSIENNNFTELPESIGDLINLTHFYISRNSIITFPNSFKNLTQLVTLDINNNKIKEIPDFFGLFRHLKRLDLTDNEIAILPDIFKKLNELSILKLKRNPLSDLPNSIAFLTKLKEFECDYSRLSEESLYKHYSLAGVQAIDRAKQNENVRSEIIEMAEELRAAFLGYLSFFDDYVKQAKDRLITFKATKHPKGILMEVEVNSSINASEVREYIIEFMSYLKSETIDVFENVVATRTEQEKRLLEMEINDLKRNFESRVERVSFKKELEKQSEINTIQSKYNEQLLQIIGQISGGSFAPSVNVNIENNNIAKSILKINSDFNENFENLLLTLNELGLKKSVDVEISAVKQNISQNDDEKSLTYFKSLFEKLTKNISQTKTWLIDTPALLSLLQKLYENVNQLIFPIDIPAKSDLLIAIESVISNLS